MAPLVLEGELPARWSEEAVTRLRSGLARGSVHVRAAEIAADCRTPQCWEGQSDLADADFVVLTTLRVGGERDYGLSIDVRSIATGKSVASIEGTCELCGFEEAVAMVETRAAVLAPEVARLGAALPVLLFRSEPVGATVSIDGEVRGATPLQVQAPAGSHTVEASMAGFLPQTFEIDAVDGVRKEVELRLVPRPDDPLPQGRGLVIAGAVTTSVGVAALAAGVTLLVLDGRPYRRRCEADATGRCQFDYETTIGGAVGTSIGAAALVTGVTLIAVGVARGRRARSRTHSRVRPVPGGLAVRF